MSIEDRLRETDFLIINSSCGEEDVDLAMSPEEADKAHITLKCYPLKKLKGSSECINTIKRLKCDAGHRNFVSCEKLISENESEQTTDRLIKKFLPLQKGNLSWPAFKKWTWEYLCKAAGHRYVPVERGSTMMDSKREIIKFGELLSYIINNDDNKERVYMPQHKLTYQVPSLYSDLKPVPEGVPEGTQPVVFIGPKQTFTPLHTDPVTNMFVQVKGSKYVRLFPSVAVTETSITAAELDSEGTYLMRRLNEGLEISLPDFSKGFCGELLEGQSVIIPPNWFHSMLSLEESISVAYWY